MASPGTVTVKILGDASGLKQTLGEVDGHVGRIGSSFKGLAVAAGGLFAAAGIGGLAKSALDAALESQKVTKLTDAVIKSTGGSANVTADHVQKLSEKLSELDGVDHELVAHSEDVLLTFTKVKNTVGEGNDIFDQATQAALNMSAALGTDLQSATVMLGKALNDPVKGITALQRAGVSFTAQQKDQIKTLVAAGNTLGAQKVILKEFNSEFGGAAAAAANPMDRLKVTVKDLEEKVGLALLPTIQKAATWLADVLPGALDRTSKAIKPLIDGARQVIDVLFHGDFTGGGPFSEDSKFIDTLFNIRDVFIGQVLPVIRQVVAWLQDNWKTALIVAGAAVLLLISPIALVVAALVAAWVEFAGFRDLVRDVVGAVVGFFQGLVTGVRTRMDAIKEAVRHVTDAIVGLWNTFGDNIITAIKIAWDEIHILVAAAISIVRDIVDFVLALINGDWGKAWDALKDIASTVFTAIVETIGNIGKLLLDALAAVGDGLYRVWLWVWGGISGVVSGVADDIIGFVKGIPGRLVGALDGVANLITAPYRAAFNAIASLWNNTLGKLHFTIPSWVPGVGGKGFDVPDIPVLDSGGVVSSPTLALLAANSRPEAIVPLDRAGGMGGDTYILNAPSYLGDKRDLMAVFQEMVVRSGRRNGNTSGSVFGGLA